MNPKKLPRAPAARGERFGKRPGSVLATKARMSTSPMGELDSGPKKTPYSLGLASHMAGRSWGVTLAVRTKALVANRARG